MMLNNQTKQILAKQRYRKEMRDALFITYMQIVRAFSFAHNNA